MKDKKYKSNVNFNKIDYDNIKILKAGTSMETGNIFIEYRELVGGER